MGDWDEQGHGQRWAPLADVAAAYGVSIDTVRRRMKRGELEARRQQTPQGFKWLALMPDASEPESSDPPRNAAGSSPPSDATTLEVQIVERDREELVVTLRQELALRNREISRLHEVIASQATAITQATSALPATTLSVPEIGQPSGSALPPKAINSESAGLDEQRETLWDRFRRWLTG